MSDPNLSGGSPNETEVDGAQNEPEDDEGSDGEAKTSGVTSWFSRKTYAAAFGRYEGIGPSEEPENAALLGRRRERARFLDLLFSVGGKGAYLITGHRGSGKTTFVDYCLAEYRRDIFERFLRGNVGRAFLWDRMGLTFIAFLLLLVGILIHESLFYLVNHPIHWLIRVPLLALFTLLALFPFISALSRLNLIFERMGTTLRRRAETQDNDRSRALARHAASFLFGDREPNPRPILALLGLVVTVLFVLSIEHPSATMTQLILLCGWTFYGSVMISLYYSEELPPEEREQGELPRMIDRAIMTALLVIGGFVLVFLLTLQPQNGQHDSLFGELPIVLAVALFGLGLIGIAVQKRHALKIWEAPKGDRSKLRKTRLSIRSSALWHQLAGLGALAASAAWFVLHLQPLGELPRFVILLALSLATALPLVLWWASWNHHNNVVPKKTPGEDVEPQKAPGEAEEQPPPGGNGGNPTATSEDKSLDACIRSLRLAASGALQRPTLLLLLKATIFVVIGLQVSFPLLLSGAEACSEALEGYSAQRIADQLLGTLGSAEETKRVLFTGLGEEISTVLGWLLLLSFINFLEYEWIIRAHHNERQDPALRTASDRESVDSPSLADAYLDRPYHLRLAKQTFFYEIYSSWLPVLVVPVNLGFDTLDHRRVVEAMLAGLRDVYRATFFRWSSLFYLSIRVFSLLLTLSLTALSAYHSFCLAPNQLNSLARERFCIEHVPASLDPLLAGGPFKTRLPMEGSSTLEMELKAGRKPPSEEPAWDTAMTVPPAMRLSCHIAGEPLAQFLQWDLIWTRPADIGRSPEVEAVREGTLAAPILGIFFPETRSTSAQAHSVTPGSAPRLRLYHPLLFLLISSLGTWILGRYPLLPYTRTLRSIEELLASLSSRLHEESRIDTSPLSRILSFFTGEERIRHREADPFDPRSVELATLAILQDIQSPTIELPFLTHHRVNLPMPEIVFKFDELDKLGLGVIPPHDTTGPETAQSDLLNQERQRSQALRQLFSDLKNVVSCGNARFIFVGGRNLHDEWLADQTARRPLLTNIFEDELYLPSLMIDSSPNRQAERLWQGVEDYLVLQRQRAEALNQKSLDLRVRPWLTPWISRRVEPAFSTPKRTTQKPLADTADCHPESPASPGAARLPTTTTPAETEELPALEPLPETGNWRGTEGPVSAGSSKTEQALAAVWAGVMRWCLAPLGLEADGDPAFDDDDGGAGLQEPLGSSIRLCGRSTQRSPDWHPSFQRDFVHFLTYRSQGNVKQIRTLLEEFIFPAGTVMAAGECVDMAFDCQHVLRFRDIDRFRIQMIANIYRQIAAAFDPRLAYRDDKLVVGVLYLSDFLLKFHRRAFAWASLQKVDELAHIHRAPDLPHAMSELVHDWTEPFLHSIRNGMYDFRFNSDFAREIEYLSRRSEEELAAFNFTLDESQALKAIYRSRIEAVKEPESWEFIAALGELHEFDEEYEVARYYYAQAIDLLDRHFHTQVASPDATPAVYQVLSDRSTGQEVVRRRLSWGVSRLRLKLQIGMSFEKARELEQAQVHYRNARTLAAAMLEALLSPEWGLGFEDPFYSDAPDEGGPDYVSTLKHLNVVFQPAFAEAWVSEKVVGGVDTSLRLLERRLWELRWQLPLVRTEFLAQKEEQDDTPADPRSGSAGHANFTLAMAEQHNKTGDLYFLKGHQPPHAGRRNPSSPYLSRAQYHYALSLHEIRFFNHYRHRSMERANQTIGLRVDEDLADGAWGDFVFRAAAGSFADLSETFLAQTSFFRLLRSLEADPASPERPNPLDSLDRIEQRVGNCCRSIRRWLTLPPSQGGGQRPRSESWSSQVAQLFAMVEKGKNGHDLDDWLGSIARVPLVSLESPTGRTFEPGAKDLPNRGDEARPMRHARVRELLSFGNDNPRDDERVTHYFIFCLSAGDMLERAGYLQDAARKHLRVLEAINHYIWWIASTSRVCTVLQLPADSLTARATEDAKRFRPTRLTAEILALAVYALQRASNLAQRGRVHIEPLVLGNNPADSATSSGEPPVLLGRQIPVRALTLCCSLALASINLAKELMIPKKELGDPTLNLRKVLQHLADEIVSWMPGEATRFSPSFEEYLSNQPRIEKSARDDGSGSPPPTIVQKWLSHYQQAFRGLLIETLDHYAYPMLHRLYGLKALADDEILEALRPSTSRRWHQEDLLAQATDHVEELVELEDIYESPMHFVPLHSGSTYALYYLLVTSDDDGSLWRTAQARLRRKHRGASRKRFAHLALERLGQSREMVSMGRAYYKAISGLYYLYDDFNDRFVHYNHALQMAGADFRALLTELVEERLRTKDKEGIGLDRRNSR